MRTSDLADTVIARVYDIAVAEARTARPPAEPDYQPAHQMWVIALGRLGMREFDLASDADLVFVLPWNLNAEITEQMRFIREWEGRFILPVTCGYHARPA